MDYFRVKIDVGTAGWKVLDNVMLELKLNFSKSCHKVTPAVYTLKVMFVKIAQCHTLRLILEETLRPRTLRDRPIWSHWYWLCRPQQQQQKHLGINLLIHRT